MPFLRRLFVTALVVILACLYRPHRIVTVNRPAKSMDSRLLAFDEALVTRNPDLDRSNDTLDHERCAKLHNRLVHYGWVASGRPLEGLPQRSFFDVHQDEAEALRRRLDASLVAFLDSVTMADQFEVPFFFWVSGIAQPSDMFPYDNGLFPENDGEHDRFLILYSTNVGMGEHAAGLIYDQVHHRATMALGIEDLGFTLPVEDHEDLWHPLEAVLSNWIEMVRIGKITASQDDAANEKYGPWTWQPYAARQVDSTIAAFARLVAAIEDRVPGGSLLPARDGPLLTDADLDAASVPKTCFARSLLTALPVPRFTAIAPGLLVPRDPEAFAVSQRFTTMNASSDAGVVIPPVLLFAAADGRTTDFDSPNPYESRNPFVQVYRDGVAHGDHSIPAGLYSESVDRSETDYAEEGFRLVLPFALGMRGVVDGRQGARKSDGQSVSEGSVAELFQHGFKPFGGEWWRAQRLERLLDRWRELVETGVWTVGEKGVEGTIELFAEADSDRWMHYWIPPDW